MKEGPGKKRPDEPDISRRNFLRNMVGMGVGAAAISQAARLGLEAGVQTEKGRELYVEHLRQFPPLAMPDEIGGNLVFVGAAHTPENVRENFDELVAAVRASDIILLETGDLPPKYYEENNLINLSDEALKEKVMGASEKDFDFFDFITLLAVRERKQVVSTDPNTGVMGKTDLKEFDEMTSSTEFHTFIAALAGMTLSEFSNNPTRREAILKIIAAPALATHVGAKLLSGNSLGRAVNSLVLPDALQQYPFGKEVLEISTYNYRDFSSVRGLYAIAEALPGYFKDKTVGAFYGAAHFPIMQILRLPKNVVEAKVDLYRKLDSTIKPKPAEIREFDRNVVDTWTKERGAWKTIAEVNY